jgi:cobalt-zinc-cadmium efflux system protein
MLGDAAVSVGVVAAGVAVALTSFTWLDPVVSFLIAGVILAGSWRLLTQSLALNLDAVPRRLTLREISDALRSLPGVTEVHDLHVWSTSTTSVALTAHLVLPEPHSSDKLLKQATELLSSKFKITHSTIQIEREKLFEEHCGCP